MIMKPIQDGWKSGRFYRLRTANGELKFESSDPKEIKKRYSSGDVITKEMIYTKTWWEPLSGLALDNEIEKRN